MKAIPINRYKTVFFDLFYTLTTIESTNPGYLPTHKRLGVSRRDWVKVSLDNYYDRGVGNIKDPYEIIRKLTRALIPHISESKIKEVTEARIAQFRRALKKIPAETLETLEGLKKRGKKIGLISNADHLDILHWDESPLVSLFDSVTFSCLVGSIKPEEKIYRTALEALSTSPEEALFVGDGGNEELMGARRLGMTTVMITELTSLYWPDPIPERRPHADYEINHITELLG